MFHKEHFHPVLTIVDMLSNKFGINDDGQDDETLLKQVQDKNSETVSDSPSSPSRLTISPSRLPIPTLPTSQSFSTITSALIDIKKEMKSDLILGAVKSGPFVLVFHCAT